MLIEGEYPIFAFIELALMQSLIDSNVISITLINSQLGAFMSRTFYLSCNGLLDSSQKSVEALSHALSQLVNDTKTLNLLLVATTTNPCRINTINGTLTEARMMDSSLMALGLFSEIFVLNSKFPNRPGVFINERLGTRRSTSLTFPPLDVSSDISNQRSQKGRRREDR